ncbi:ATP-binding protein [Desulforhabdus amnigena]|jgi:anti-sigma regulatory factor (Ser/Thr protein kinase)|uniref:Sigma factor serine-protein kinase n=1 Tax=Desulforhabdus amnigena TaxID=40218 RepID=A0A9W6FTN5_9BACT|nr:ATP-binding protein [Desulforhabdus amnigena]NLJ29361.1 ATP-binding protein [Deltaproteobacteria bacterium]GLI34370.1 sigma factor serine-protein kinase [Desulforhabdus amnigena]
MSHKSFAVGEDIKTLRLPASIDSLEKFRAFLLQEINPRNVPEDLIHKIELVLEELLANVIHYAYPDIQGEVAVACFMEGGEKFSLVIQDWGRPFNPFDQENPDIFEDIRDRVIGGLGILLVRSMADEYSYRRRGETNIVKVSFKLRH